MYKSAKLVLILGLLSFIIGCGSSSDNLSSGTIKTIIIEPPSAFVPIGTIIHFVGKAYDKNNDEVSFSPTWFDSPSGLGSIIESGWANNRPYISFEVTGATTGELHCLENSIDASATIVGTTDSVSSITVTPKTKTIVKGDTWTFVATADSGGTLITAIDATWEVTGSIGTIEKTSGGEGKFYSSSVGTEYINAYFMDKMGSAEITVSGTVNTVSIEASADVYVDKENPTTNYSGVSYLYVGGQNSLTSTYEALIKFDLSSLSIPTYAVVKSVYIRLYATSPASESFTSRFLKIDGTWSEAGVTWNTKPSNSTNIGERSISSSGIYYILLEEEGNDLVEAWVDTPSSNYGICIVNPYGGNGIVTFADRTASSSNLPKIIIEYEE